MSQANQNQAALSMLRQLEYGERGLTRNEMRDQAPDLPASIYLHLPDSKRFRSADEVTHEVQTSSARAEGEFLPADDDTPPDGAQADFGPAGYGDSPLVSPSVVGPSANTPVTGYDGNSLETEQEFTDSGEH